MEVITDAIIDIMRVKLDKGLIRKTKLMSEMGITYYELCNLLNYGAKRRTSKRGRKVGYRKRRVATPHEAVTEI